MPVTDPATPMTEAEREAAHADIGEIGASPHVDVTDAQPAPVDMPSAREQFQKVLDQLGHPTNLDLHARLHAIETAVRQIGAILLPHLDRTPRM